MSPRSESNRSTRRVRLDAILPLVGLAALSLACSASGGDAAPPGPGGGSADGSGSGQGDGSSQGSGNGTGSPVLGGGDGSSGVSGERPDEELPLPTVEGGTDFTGFDVEAGQREPGEGCQQAARAFVPQIPTVFMLVDRSDTMFAPAAGGVSPWNALRGGALQVIEELQAEVRFGFGAFSGAAGGVCPLMPSEAPSLQNHQAISQLYMSLEQPVNSKETPTLLALREVAEVLWADETPGAKYVLFVTDGEPDYCDDGPALCPADSVVQRLQQLRLGLDDEGNQFDPINTLVFGLETPANPISFEVLQAFANAGAGQPVAPMTANLDDVYYNCSSRPGWVADMTLLGRPLQVGQTAGEYAVAGGTAPVFRPDPTDQAALADEIRQALAGVKSCTFDLGEDGVEVDVNRPELGSLARVLINGEPVPFDAANGWSMVSPTTVELAGSACETWREPVETSIDFDFPCGVIVVR